MSSRNIKLSQACEGMIRYEQAAGKSDGTINDYRVTFKKLQRFCIDRIFYGLDKKAVTTIRCTSTRYGWHEMSVTLASRVGAMTSTAVGSTSCVPIMT